MNGVNLNVAGLASGFDWSSLVDQMIQAERAPETQMKDHQNTLNQKKQAFSDIQTELQTLQSKVDVLKDPAFFGNRLATVSDTTKATASAASGALIGSFDFNVSQLATAAVQQGAANIGAALSSSSNVSGVILGSAGFATPVTAGTITVDGKQVTVSTSDSLQTVFDNINTATGGAVTGSYDPTTDKITLSSASPIVLGSATDSSNFLQAAQLYNNGTGTTTSMNALGAVRADQALTNGNFTTAVSDGGSGAGEFKINGVSISFNASTDSLNDVIGRINASTAGVVASYDATNDRLLLTNKSTGDIGIALQDVTGNFLAATGASGGTLQRGDNLTYTVNNGNPLTSFSNTITDANSGISGLSVTALATGSFSVSVGSDTQKISSAISDFVTEYNKAQSMITTQTASTTDAQGKVTAGILAGDQDANLLASKLRSLAATWVSGASAGLQNLDSLGIHANGYNDTLTLPDAATLNNALSNHLDDVAKIFTDSSQGIATQFDNYLSAATGDGGLLDTRENDLTKQSASIDQQISDLEKRITQSRNDLVNSFVAMEKAQAQINQQKQYLTQQFGGGSGTPATG